MDTHFHRICTVANSGTDPEKDMYIVRTVPHIIFNRYLDFVVVESSQISNFRDLVAQLAINSMYEFLKFIPLLV